MTVSIAIIVAMESERRHLDSLMPGWEPVGHAVWPTQRKDDVICVTSGIGMVSAAAATEHVINEYKPTMIMNFGCAGAHHEELFPGDVVIGDRLIHQGRMRFAPNGEIIPLEVGFDVPGESNQVTDVSTDTTLRKMAEDVAGALTLTAWPESARLPAQSDRTPLIKTGTVSSGDIWLQDETAINGAHERTGSLCEDMEAASIAQICALHGVPFLTVKDISNSELHESTVFDESTSALHADELGMRAATVVVGVIEKLRQIGGVKNMRYS